MSQYASRFTIIVKDGSAWEKIDKKTIVSEYGVFIHPKWIETEKSFSASCYPDELETIVEEVGDCLGKDALVIADTADINVDTYTYCVYLVNGVVKTECYEEGPKAELCEKVDIEDVAGWLKFGGFKFSENDIEWLKSFGIEV